MDKLNEHGVKELHKELKLKIKQLEKDPSDTNNKDVLLSLVSLIVLGLVEGHMQLKKILEKGD